MVAEVAPVELHVNVVLAFGAMAVGLAANVTVGVG
jgi:hypothetical protein